MSEKSNFETADSPVIAEILAVLITIILALILLLFVMNFNISMYEPPQKTPEIFKLIKIESSPPKYESKITLMHKGDKRYKNSLLRAEIYKNGNLLGCRIETMNGHEYIPTIHSYVKTMGGSGCSGDFWYPVEKTALDITDGLIKPGDEIRIDIFQKPENKIISSHTYKFKNQAL